MGDVAPWIITAVVTLAGAFLTAFAGLTALFSARSTHGLESGRCEVTSVTLGPAGDAIDVELRNVGRRDVHGLVGMATADFVEGVRTFRSVMVDRAEPNHPVRLRLLPSADQAAGSPAGAATSLSLRLRYLDHADVVRLEDRGYDASASGMLARSLEVRRSWRSFG